MGQAFTVQITDQSLRRAIRDVGAFQLRKLAAVERANVVTLKTVAKKARKRAGKKTGNLRTSIRWQLISKYGGAVGTNVNYARAHHNGTRAHEIRPKRASVLRFEAGGSIVFAKRVWHPGTKPNPFLFSAAEDERGPHTQRLKNALR